MNECLQKMIEAAHSGGEVLRKYFGATLDVEEKTMAADMRTKADLESEGAILKILESAFPNFGIHSEEMGEKNKDSHWKFVIDPLDGTNNFILGIPYFSLGIGLVREGKTQYAVVYNPILNHTYSASRGGGSFLNNRKIRVNTESRLPNATISYVTNYGGGTDWKEHKHKLLDLDDRRALKRELCIWSPLLDFCLLASGKIEAIIVNEAELYDYVPGKLIA